MFGAAAGIIGAGIAANEMQRRMAAADERRQHQMNRDQDAVIRNLWDPFQTLNESQFRKKFRLSKEIARWLCEQIAPALPEEGRTATIPRTVQILTTLHFYASGSYQQSIAVMKYFCISQSTVSRVIANVTIAIINELADERIHFPDTDEELRRNSEAFQIEALFPGIVGCIDCTHIPMIAPRHEGWLFKNYKGYFSMNIQVTCDHRARITSIDAWPGSNNDATIWRALSVEETMERLRREIPRPYFLLGDSGYPISEISLTPIPDAEEDTPEYDFTRRHTHTRSIVERTFGILKGRFRCLYKLRGLGYDSQKVVQFFVACAILHNVMIDYRMELEEYIADDDDDINVEDPRINNADDDDIEQDESNLVKGRRLRGNIIETYFT